MDVNEKPAFEDMLNATSNGVIATDTAGQIVYMNTQARRILRLKQRKKIDLGLWDILPSIWPLARKCLSTGKAQLGWHQNSGGVNLMVTVTAIRMRGQEKGVLCSIQKVEDLEISARNLESYNRLNKQWNAIFKSSSDGILVCDNKGNILNMNEASEKLNGMKAREIIGRNVMDFVKRGVFDRSVTMEVLETKRQVSILQHIKRTKRHLLVTGTPALDEEGNIFLVVVNERDMTQLNAMREQLEESRMVTEKYKDELTELSMLELREQEIFAESEETRQVLRIALKLARLEASNILILGESGTGKGLLAKFIHNNSKRRQKPFIQINCAALPEGLLEAELFGYERGAFTGAREKGKVGLFELAQEGTLFLDEIGDLPLSVQAKLLKYLDDNEIMRLGGVSPIPVDCTIIAATNRDLEYLTKTRVFRKDLFYRLNTFPIRIPPLRERPEDIFTLVTYFLEKYTKTYGLKRRISSGAFGALQSYPFPGNVRELKNLIKKAVVMSEREVLDESIVRGLGQGKEKWGVDSERKNRMSIRDEILHVEKEILKNAMEKCKTTREMADYLNVSQPTIVRKLKRHGFGPPVIQ